MNDNIEENELTLEEVLKQNQKLKKEYEKLEKRFDRNSNQADRLQKQQEKSNEQLEAYIDVIDDNIISINTDKDRKITSISIAFSNTFGYKKEELEGKESFIFLINKEDSEKVDAVLKDCETSHEPWHGEVRFISKSNQLVWTNTIITPNYDENEFDCFTVISKDISKEKELKELK